MSSSTHTVREFLPFAIATGPVQFKSVDSSTSSTTAWYVKTSTKTSYERRKTFTMKRGRDKGGYKSER